MAIGDTEGAQQQMSNVLRIYNDRVGVELCQRTGRSPNYKYLQLGCSKRAEQDMLRFALAQRGKPFDMSAMLRSIAWPRTTRNRSFFCAELVASCLQAGGLMSTDSNPGAATPQSLFNLYSKDAAVSGNPMTMRLLSSAHRSEAVDMEAGINTRGARAQLAPQLQLSLGTAQVAQINRDARMQVGAPVGLAGHSGHNAYNAHGAHGAHGAHNGGFGARLGPRVGATGYACGVSKPDMHDAARWVMTDALDLHGFQRARDPRFQPAPNAYRPAEPVQLMGATPNVAEQRLRNAVRGACLKQQQLMAYQAQQQRLSTAHRSMWPRAHSHA
jgi:hypothetical protein